MSLSVYVGEDQLLPSTSGLGFFGEDGFGSPVLIGEYQGRTFVTNSSGTIEGFECNNNRFVSLSGVINGQDGSGILLTSLPNRLATINIRLETPNVVRTLNGRFYIFDGSLNGSQPNIDNDPSGLTSYCAEIRHTSDIQDNDGVGDTEWFDTHGSTFIGTISSPGSGGFRPDGSLTLDIRHDWYIALSVTPTQFGNKQFGMYFEVEYL